MTIVEQIMEYLRRDGFELVPTGRPDHYWVDVPAVLPFVHRPILVVPADATSRYVERIAQEVEPDRTDGSPATEHAATLSGMHIQEELGKSDGVTPNSIRRIGFRISRGAAEMFVEKDDSDPQVAYTPGNLRWTTER